MASILPAIVLLGLLLAAFPLRGDPTLTGHTFAVLVAAQSKIEEDLKQERFDAESTQRSIQSAVPGAFVYVSSGGVIFVSLGNEIAVVLEPKLLGNKSVTWKCTTRFSVVRNKERAERLRCAQLVIIDSRIAK